MRAVRRRLWLSVGHGTALLDQREPAMRCQLGHMSVEAAGLHLDFCATGLASNEILYGETMCLMAPRRVRRPCQDTVAAEKPVRQGLELTMDRLRLCFSSISESDLRKTLLGTPSGDNRGTSARGRGVKQGSLRPLWPFGPRASSLHNRGTGLEYSGIADRVGLYAIAIRY